MSLPRRAVTMLAIIVAMVAGGARAARAGDPDREWRTIESAHFVVTYYEPLGDVARRVAVVAERAHRILAPQLGHEPTEKTQILLVDETDGANGFASVLPRNQITLYATAPNADSVLADHDDWLYGLVAHEYTHILHLDTIGGLPALYNALFGKTWSPNQVMPRWIIEGIATYEESRQSSSGRIRSTQFDMYLRVPVLQGKELGLDEVSNNPIRFPRGNAAYLYGSHFLKFVFDRHGADALRRMSHVNGSQTTPFAVNRQLAEVTGRGFDDLYDEWRAHLRAKATLQLEAVLRHVPRAGRPVTFHGEAVRNPRYSRDGRELYWLDSDGVRDQAIRAVPVGGNEGDERDVRVIERVGGFDVDGEGGLLYEQNWTFKDVYSFQDLFHWDATSGRIDRLTRGERAREPAIAPDGDRFAFSRNGRSRSELVVGDRRAPDQRTVVWSGDGRYDQGEQPAWSPDGTRLAFVAWRAGGLRDILVARVDGGGPALEVTRDRALDTDPVWAPDGKTIYFISDRTGIANAYAYDVDGGATWQVTNVIGGVSELAVSPDGTRLAYTDFVGSGYDLYELAIDRRQWTPARPYVDDRPPPTVVRDDEVEVSAPRRYRPLETLAPQAWTGQLVLGTFGQAVDLRTNGSDVAGLHSYDLGVSVDLGRGDLGFGLSYGYAGLRPGLRLALARRIARRTSIRLGGRPTAWTEEVLSITGGVGLPVRHNDESSLAMSFDYDVDWIRRVEAPSLTSLPDQPLPVVPLSDYVTAGLALRASYAHVRGVLYGVGPTKGFEASGSLRLDHPALGATYRGLTLSWFARGYRKLWGVTPTLALRIVGGMRTSDLGRGAAFALGGQPTQDVVQAIMDSTRASTTGFLRGYPPRVLTGNTYHLANLEYRQQLVQIERGASTLPIFVKRLHLAVLVDAGMAYDDEISADRLRMSVGAALRLDTLVGFYVPGALELGYAHGLWSDGIGEAWLHLASTI